MLLLGYVNYIFTIMKLILVPANIFWLQKWISNIQGWNHKKSTFISVIGIILKHPCNPLSCGTLTTDRGEKHTFTQRRLCRELMDVWWGSLYVVIRKGDSELISHWPTVVRTSSGFGTSTNKDTTGRCGRSQGRSNWNLNLLMCEHDSLDYNGPKELYNLSPCQQHKSLEYPQLKIKSMPQHLCQCFLSCLGEPWCPHQTSCCTW